MIKEQGGIKIRDGQMCFLQFISGYSRVNGLSDVFIVSCPFYFCFSFFVYFNLLFHFLALYFSLECQCILFLR